MKKILALVSSVAFLALALTVFLATPSKAQAQVATPVCPARYICTIMPPQPTGCPTGYICTLANGSAPYISSVTNSVAYGDTMTITGTGLNGSGQIYIDGTGLYNVVVGGASDGTSLSFTFPSSYTAGGHLLYVKNDTTGTSNSVKFAVTASSSSCYTFTRNLTIGSTGGDVSALQTWLIARGFDIPAISSGNQSKGYYDPQTSRAVAQYQTSIGIPSTGYFGPMTRAAVNASCTTTPPTSTQPVITSLSANSGTPGTVITVYGYNFSTSVANQVTFDNATHDTGVPGITSSDGKTISFTVFPKVSTADLGLYSIFVENTAGQRSNAVQFTILPQTSAAQPPVISGVTAPTQLNVGQVGTWTVIASDPSNTYLRYGVDWGDSKAPEKGTAFTASVQQTATFTHSYAYPGNYTVTFMVTNASGLSAQTSTMVSIVGSVEQPTITVTSPWSGGEKVAAGSNYTVRWTSTGIPASTNMLIYIVGNNYSKMVGNAPNIGYQQIMIPSELGGAYEMMVQATVNGQVRSGSVPFAIVPVTVTQPIYGCTNPSALNYNPSATSDNGTCVFGGVTPPIPATSTNAVTMSATAVLVDTNSDKVGAGIWTSGKGATSGIANDWHWTLNVSVTGLTGQQVMGVKSIVVYNGQLKYGQGWSTSASTNNDLGITLYPLKVNNNGYETNGYDQSLNIIFNDHITSRTVDLYGQVERKSFSEGGRAVITFDNNQTVTAVIPPSTMVPGAVVSSTGFTGYSAQAGSVWGMIMSLFK